MSIAPAYERDGVALYCGDCLDVLPTLAAGSVDAFVMDPPYCSGSVAESHRTAAKAQGVRDKRRQRFGWFVGDNMGTAGYIWMMRAVANQVLRVQKETGSFLVFCDWRMVSSLAPAIESVGLRHQGIVVWDKGHLGMGAGFRCQHEFILHYTAGAPEYHSRSISNVIQCKRVHVNDREHHTQKPVELLVQMLRVAAPEAGTVADPFTGSGSTGVACVQTGRKFIGIEKEPKYFDIAVKRIEKALADKAATLQFAGAGG